MVASPTTNFPARLHVLLARDAPTGVIIRRGPSKRVCTIGWNREDDTFALGQWLKGRIYERRSDLSPDGRHLLYFVMSGTRSGYSDAATNGSWTALSRAPYLKAIGLWGKGDCWHGGGLFIDNHSYWINDGYGHNPIRTSTSLRRVAEYPDKISYHGECPGVYYPRLIRDGWIFKEKTEIRQHHRIDIFEKRISNIWTLRKLAHATIDRPVGKGCYYDEHELENAKTKEKIDCAAWEWAEVDRHRLVWTQDGKLFAGRIGTQGMGQIAELQDFNAMTFEPIAAPY